MIQDNGIQPSPANRGGALGPEAEREGRSQRTGRGRRTPVARGEPSGAAFMLEA